MRSAAGLTKENTIELTGSGEVKRRSYMDLVVGMLCKCSLLQDVKSEQFESPVQSLLNDVDMIATAGKEGCGFHSWACYARCQKWTDCCTSKLLGVCDPELRTGSKVALV